MEIELGKVKELDIELLRKWRMSPEVTRYMKTDPIITKKEQRRWYRELCQDTRNYCWIIKCDGVRIGFLSINNIDDVNKSCEIGHYIGDRNYLKKGIAKIVEANIYDYIFWKIGLEIVVFNIFKENRAACCLHQSLGAIEIENENKIHIKNNKEYEIVTLCMTRSIWKKIKNSIVYPRITIE